MAVQPNDKLVEITGTITTIEPPSIGASDVFHQRLLLENAQPVNVAVALPRKLLLTVQYPIGSTIPFQLGTPITAKGFFRQSSADSLSYMYNLHAPAGYIRYNGKIYR